MVDTVVMAVVVVVISVDIHVVVVAVVVVVAAVVAAVGPALKVNVPLTIVLNGLVVDKFDGLVMVGVGRFIGGLLIEVSLMVWPPGSTSLKLMPEKVFNQVKSSI